MERSARVWREVPPLQVDGGSLLLSTLLGFDFFIFGGKRLVEDKGKEGCRHGDRCLWHITWRKQGLLKLRCKISIDGSLLNAVVVCCMTVRWCRFAEGWIGALSGCNCFDSLVLWQFWLSMEWPLHSPSGSNLALVSLLPTIPRCGLGWTASVGGSNGSSSRWEWHPSLCVVCFLCHVPRRFSHCRDADLLVAFFLGSCRCLSRVCKEMALKPHDCLIVVFLLPSVFHLRLQFKPLSSLFCYCNPRLRSPVWLGFITLVLWLGYSHLVAVERHQLHDCVTPALWLWVKAGLGFGCSDPRVLSSVFSPFRV
eukprot:Gb_14427 [translate_table: standard]